MGETGSVRRGIVLRPGNNLVEAGIAIRNPKLWSPEQPHLYTLRASVVSAAGLLDSVEQRFGMREFVLRGDSYFLNGKKTYIKAGFLGRLLSEHARFSVGRSGDPAGDTLGQGGGV